MADGDSDVMAKFDEIGVDVPGSSDVLGRGIVDSNGNPSGSPANWENTIGVSSDRGVFTADELADQQAAILSGLAVSMGPRASSVKGLVQADRKQAENKNADINGPIDL